jgi:hypothetical protein
MILVSIAAACCSRVIERVTRLLSELLLPRPERFRTAAAIGYPAGGPPWTRGIAMAHLILFDASLGSNPTHLRQGPSYLFKAERGKASLATFLDDVARQVPKGSVDGMTIYAHASEALLESDSRRQTVLGVYGFWLGETVNGSNVGQFSKIAPLFDKPRQRICNLLACQQVYSGGVDAEAEVDDGSIVLAGDNRTVVKNLAGALNQYVRAADAAQVFETSQSLLGLITGEKTFDFGEWEGNVYSFSPLDGKSEKLPKLQGKY